MVKRIIDLRFLRRSTKIGISLMGLLLLFAACVSKQQEEKVVSVTIEPQRYFAERIAGDRFTIHCVVPEGQSPETYDPTPRQMVRIGQGQAYLRIGTIGFELAWMDNIQANNPEMRVFDLSEGIQPFLAGSAYMEFHRWRTAHREEYARCVHGFGSGRGGLLSSELRGTNEGDSRDGSRHLLFITSPAA